MLPRQRPSTDSTDYLLRNLWNSKLAPKHGAWPPAAGEILIECDAFQVAGAKIGDTVIIQTANGIEQPLVVSSSVHDVGQAQARMKNIVYGYINLATLVQLGEKPYLDRLNILVAENRFDENHIRKLILTSTFIGGVECGGEFCACVAGVARYSAGGAGVRVRPRIKRDLGCAAQNKIRDPM